MEPKTNPRRLHLFTHTRPPTQSPGQKNNYEHFLLCPHCQTNRNCRPWTQRSLFSTFLSRVAELKTSDVGSLFINSTLYNLPCARQYELTDNLRMRSRKHGQKCDCAGHLHNLCRGRKFILNAYGIQWHIMKKVKTQVWLQFNVSDIWDSRDHTFASTRQFRYMSYGNAEHENKKQKLCVLEKMS